LGYFIVGIAVREDDVLAAGVEQHPNTEDARAMGDICEDNIVDIRALQHGIGLCMDGPTMLQPFPRRIAHARARMVRAVWHTGRWSVVTSCQSMLVAINEDASNALRPAATGGPFCGQGRHAQKVFVLIWTAH